MAEQGLQEVRNPSAIFLSRHAHAGCRQRGHGGARRQPADAGRSAGARRRRAGHESAPRRRRLRIEPARAAARGAASARRRRDRGTATSSSTSSAACASAKPRPTCPRCSPWCRACADEPLAAGLVCFGELGLAGEIRPVPYGEERLREAAKQGFKRAMVPAANEPRRAIEGHGGRRRRAARGRATTARSERSRRARWPVPPAACAPSSPRCRPSAGSRASSRRCAALVPGSGIVSRYSTIRPFSVRGPSSAGSSPACDSACARSPRRSRRSCRRARDARPCAARRVAR